MTLRTLLDKLGVPVDGVPAADLDRDVDVVIGAHHFDVLQVVTRTDGPIRLELTAVDDDR